MGRAAITLLLGGLSATGFAPLSLWPLLLLCLAACMEIVRRAPSLRTALFLGWAFGWAQFSVGLSWMAHAFTFQDAMPHWLGWFAAPGLALYLALYPALAAGLAWRWGRESLHAYPLIFAASWIVTEWLRSVIFTGFPWNPLGVALVDHAGPARFVGTYGLSGLMTLASGALLWIAHRRYRSGGGTVFALAALAWATTPNLTEVTKTPILIAQPNIGQQDKYREDFEAKNFAKLVSVTPQSVGQGRLIFWPEAAIPYNLGGSEAVDARDRVRIARLLGKDDILLTGADMIYAVRRAAGFGEEVRSIAAANSVFAMDARGRLLWRYDKGHLVPFGEYLPLRAVLTPIGLSRLVPGDMDFLPGPGPQHFPLPNGAKPGMQICYEIIFSGKVVGGGARPDFIFNPSNDAWYGAWLPPQFLAQARLRALEEGLPVIRSTPTGISAIISADGKVRQSIPLGTAGSIAGTVPKAAPPTVFARFGNLAALLFALLLAGFGIALGRRLR